VGRTEKPPLAQISLTVPPGWIAAQEKAPGVPPGTKITACISFKKTVPLIHPLMGELHPYMMYKHDDDALLTCHDPLFDMP
jgi:hypothetical protein